MMNPYAPPAAQEKSRPKTFFIRSGLPRLASRMANLLLLNVAAGATGLILAIQSERPPQNGIRWWLVALVPFIVIQVILRTLRKLDAKLVRQAKRIFSRPPLAISRVKRVTPAGPEVRGALCLLDDEVRFFVPYSRTGDVVTLPFRAIADLKAEPEDRRLTFVLRDGHQEVFRTPCSEAWREELWRFIQGRNE